MTHEPCFLPSPLPRKYSHSNTINTPFFEQIIIRGRLAIPAKMMIFIYFTIKSFCILFKYQPKNFPLILIKIKKINDLPPL